MIGLIFLASLLAVNAAPESRQASMGIQVCSGPGNCQCVLYKLQFNCVFQNPSQGEYESGWGIKFNNGNEMTLTSDTRTYLTSAHNSNQLSILDY
uniref:Secreted protein n=1 Tax=Daphnia galeata TaxID=27404 RepID=A0A8J2RA95_9CRUS|nr:unnamed protein product [Daphnia galeata]